ncbi:MAG: enoyl-CoA hydratase/isomerase family protein, partial [Rhodococcus sp. (in: high G+C Gram-positive bacteria)]
MLDVDTRDNITTIVLDNGKMNTLDIELLNELSKQFRSLHSSNGGAVVLTGTGPAFSAGVDLAQMAAGGTAYIEAFLPALSATLLDIFTCPVPVIAAINGHALGGGCLLAIAADVRLMGSGKIGIPELTVGVPLPTVGVEILRSAVGTRVGELINNATVTSASNALELGLVTGEAPEELAARAHEQACRLAAVPTTTFALTKRQLRAPYVASIEA